MKPKTVLIKKYENRRLYDSTNSRYVNLDEVAQMVKDGQEIQVVDAATGEDLTRLVLTQIIAENAKAPDSAFPIDVLRQMVIATGKATQEGTMKYMQTVLEMYQNAFRAMSPPLNPFEFMRPAPANPQTSSSTAAAGQASSRRPSPDESAGGDEVGDLKQRVQELESLVSRMAGRKPRSKRNPARRRAP
jgi:polyhydroxyalkanoate synthesis repressor PhaR